MRLKGAIFDMDGTLLDSMPLWNTRGSDFIRENGLAPEPGIDDKFKAMSLRQSAEYFHDVCRIPGTVEEIIDRINACVEKGYRRVLPKPGAVEFLDYLKQNGVRMTVATATERYLVEGVLTRLGMLPYFDAIFTCNEVGASKAQPLIFHRAVAFMGTAVEDTAVFEDALFAIRTAREAGFAVCGIEDDSYAGAREELSRLCDVFVPDFTSLIGVYDLPDRG